MVLVHDDDLERININEIGEGTVSEHVINDCLVFLMLVTNVDAPTRHVDGSFQELQRRDP